MKTKTQISCTVMSLFSLLEQDNFSSSYIRYFKLQAQCHSVSLRANVCQNWSETPKTGFLASRHICPYSGPDGHCPVEGVAMATALPRCVQEKM